MTPPTELDTLFSSVWLDEAPVEVLADYLREKLSEAPSICLLATHPVRGVPVCLCVERYYGSVGVVAATVYCNYHFARFTRNFTVESVSTPEFTDWLTEQIDWHSIEALKPYWTTRSRGRTPTTATEDTDQ